MHDGLKIHCLKRIEGSNPSPPNWSFFMKGLLYSKYTVYGPYTRKDGRQHIILYNKNTHKRKTLSYPRYLMEIKLQRYLRKTETVDHKNDNYLDNDINNLQILSLGDNIRKSHSKRKLYTFICPVCGKNATKWLNQVLHNKKLGKSGPYCSRYCAGKAVKLLGLKPQS